MQSEEVDFVFTPALADTSSLMTPTIQLNAPSIKSVFNEALSRFPTNGDTSLTVNRSLILRTGAGVVSSVSSAAVHVESIEDDLKKSFNESRRPTPSPFQTISSASVPQIGRGTPNLMPTEDIDVPIAPTTADVMTALESLTNTNSLTLLPKPPVTDNPERESGVRTIGDNLRYEPTNVSPKKKLLIRSQSRTEPTSPILNNNMSPSQKYNNDFALINAQNMLDGENLMDDSANTHYTGTSDLSTLVQSNELTIDHSQQFKAIIDNGHEQHHNIPIKPEQNFVSHPNIKQQPGILNHVNNNNSINKRPVQQPIVGNNMSALKKTNTIIIPQQPLNEVTSTDQLQNAKRQRTTSMPINRTVLDFRSSYPSSSLSTLTTTAANMSTTTNGASTNVGNEDQRKKQIRDSNREAARRCRERRRQYIEQLEGNLEQYKVQVKQLSDKLSRIEHENNQLRTYLSETKILQSSRIPISEPHVDYVNVVAAAGMDLNGDPGHQLDGRTLQRNYLDRNNL